MCYEGIILWAVLSSAVLLNAALKGLYNKSLYPESYGTNKYNYFRNEGQQNRAGKRKVNKNSPADKVPPSPLIS